MVPSLVTATTSNMSGPLESVRDRARSLPPGKASHDAMVSAVAGLNVLEVRPAPEVARPAGRITVAAWNIERCKYLTDTTKLIGKTGADVLLLSEMDLGMARSGNRHTTAEIGAALNMGHVFATEFLELGLGDAREQTWHFGQVNEQGLHGNAVLARAPLAAPVRIALDDGGVWFDGQGDQRRIGGRCAVGATIETARGPLFVASLHLESHSDAEDRARQVERLLTALDQVYGDGQAVVAGDFNTAAMPRDADPADRAAEWFVSAETFEPLFARFRAAGFEWLAANTPEPTERTRPDGAPRPPFRRIDWIFTRGVSAHNPKVWPAIDKAGQAISDHELLTVEIEPV